MSSEAKKPGAEHGDDGGHGGGHGGGGHGGPPHEHEEHEEGVPEWMISFADNVCLMMGFFVILLAMNMGPKGSSAASSSSSQDSSAQSSSSASAPDMIDLAIALREAFNNPVNAMNPKPGDALLAKRILERRAKGEAEDEGPAGEREKVQSLNRGNYHALSCVVFFERDASIMTARNKEIINDLSSHLRGLRVVIEVRGHASADEAFHSNDRGMKLSFERALVVAQSLAASNVDWRQVRLIPCGDNDRVRRLAYDETSHSQNERVEVIVTDEVLEK